MISLGPLLIGAEGVEVKTGGGGKRIFAQHFVFSKKTNEVYLVVYKVLFLHASLSRKKN